MLIRECLHTAWSFTDLNLLGLLAILSWRWSRWQPALPESIKRSSHPEFVLGTPVEVPDSAGQLISIVAGLEAVPLGQRQMTEEKRKQLHEQWLTWQPSGRSKQSDLWEKNSCKEERRLLVLSLAMLPAATGKYDSGCKNKRNNLQHKLKLSAKIQQIFLLSTGWTCIKCSGHKK